MGSADIFAALLPKLQLEPGVHVNYPEAALRIQDGKPKMPDLPKERGGRDYAA